MEPTIYIVDDDAAVRESFADLLTIHGYRTRGFGSSQAFLDGCDPAGNGCVLLDIRMPDMSGLALQGELRQRGFEQPIVFVTAYGDVRLAVEAMKAGASGFLEKPCGEIDLLRTVREALKPGAPSRARHEGRSEAHAALARLTGREHEILGQILLGKSSKMIANDLGISARTVHVHRANMMMKTNTHNVVGLVRLAFAADFTSAHSIRDVAAPQQ